MFRPVAGRRERGSARLVEAERIRHALEEDRLILYCQPILDLVRGDVSQYELLLRLPVEKRGKPLPPSAFLYAAERFGLIQAIDGWVVRKAIGLIAEHARAGRRLVLNVNLSGKSIADLKLATLIEATLTETGIDPSRLIFELTETAAIANFEEARAFAGRLHGRGCRFALDDFGAGFASFSYLKNFPFDYLKIDGEFIRGLADQPDEPARGRSHRQHRARDWARRPSPSSWRTRRPPGCSADRRRSCAGLPHRHAETGIGGAPGRSDEPRRGAPARDGPRVAPRGAARASAWRRPHAG